MACRRRAFPTAPGRPSARSTVLRCHLASTFLGEHQGISFLLRKKPEGSKPSDSQVSSLATITVHSAGPDSEAVLGSTGVALPLGSEKKVLKCVIRSCTYLQFLIPKQTIHVFVPVSVRYIHCCVCIYAAQLKCVARLDGQGLPGPEMCPRSLNLTGKQQH